MTTLLELKEKLTRFYGKYDIYITPVIKFTVALTAFLLINHNIGYMEKISSTPIALILALICSILPVGENFRRFTGRYLCPDGAFRADGKEII